ncbi:MAG: glycoside hydrolase family 2 [Ferruginibacter sp.]|nr:glycoside hydrolase family 2 [Ferruginibacter sp.]
MEFLLSDQECLHHLQLNGCYNFSKYMKSYILLFFLFFTATLPICSMAQQKKVIYSSKFAPSESLVKPVEKQFRQDICLNGSWEFQPIALPENFKEGYDETPQLPRVKEDLWEITRLHIPSPWNVNSFADRNGEGGDFRTFPSYPKAWESIKMGWMRKVIHIPGSWKNQLVKLHFDAVAGDAEILVNGKAVGKHFGIFLPFEIDVTDAVKYGEDNELLIGIRKPSLFDKRSDFGRRTYQAGSFWGQHVAGIWQDAYVEAMPKVNIDDVYVKPLLEAGILEAEVTVSNNTDKPVTVILDADAYKWIPGSKPGEPAAAIPGSALEKNSSLNLAPISVEVPAHGKATALLSAIVDTQLKKWSPINPNLYGLIINTTVAGKKVDRKYTRFGWRQTALKGNQFTLNGQPFIMKGDSWHFLGIPQMTRRYAWAWFTAMRDANLNTVRLHAQPYPAFYLDMADEMGILVLDETAVWASDGGPKLDDPAYWQDSENHLAELILRDRNHPAVIGWSVSNEVMPIVRGVMHNPPGMKDNLIKYYGIWADICRRLDPSRPWISADGEDDGEGKLPTYVVHYGGLEAMSRAAKNGKPWGVGEAGNAYYGTPEQLSEYNGNRSYQSFLGRMEGVAASSYQSLIAQRERNAVYRSVFNLVWYGLKPLPLGLKDPSKPPTLQDGVFFSSFEEGKPGVQPERLGPYCTTLNPGYDPSLPLYQTWPLFDAIKDAASAVLPSPSKWAIEKPVVEPALAVATPIRSVKVLAGKDSRLVTELKRVGVPLQKLDTEEIPSLLFIDGVYPPEAAAKKVISQVYAKGGTVFICGVAQESIGSLNKLLPAPLTVSSRSASSLLPMVHDNVVNGLTAADLYFSELRPSEFTSRGLGGKLVQQSSVLLIANNTDWLKWNKQPEYAKTAMVLRSEIESKPAGAVLILKEMGEGRLIISTLPVSPRLSKAENAVRRIFTNLGIILSSGSDAGKPLLKSGEIVRTLVAGGFPFTSISEGAKQNFIDPSKGDSIKINADFGGKRWGLLYNENGLMDFSKVKLDGTGTNAAVYMSFWISSPRALDDLLIEPNIPVVNLEAAADDAFQAWLNGKLVVEKIRNGPIEGGKAVAAALKLHQGWNHILIKVLQGTGSWQFSGRLTSANQPDFIAELESALEKP